MHKLILTSLVFFLVLTSFSEPGKDSVIIFSFTQYDSTIIYIYKIT